MVEVTLIKSKYNGIPLYFLKLLIPFDLNPVVDIRKQDMLFGTRHEKERLLYNWYVDDV